MRKREAEKLKKIDNKFLRIKCSNFYGNIVWSDQFVIYYNVHKVEKYISLRGSGIEKRITLAETPCNYGGQRYWFVCDCGRRVGVLYKDGYGFQCRHCSNLTYRSRNLSGLDKEFGKIISLPDLELMESKIKRKYYRGKMTKRYAKFLYQFNRNKIIVFGRIMRLRGNYENTTKFIKK